MSWTIFSWTSAWQIPLEDTESVSFWSKEQVNVLCYKRHSSSGNAGFLSLSSTHRVSRCRGPYLHALWERDLEDAGNLDITVAVINFCLGSRVSCLLPTSTEQWHPNLWAFQESEILQASRFSYCLSVPSLRHYTSSFLFFCTP